MLFYDIYYGWNYKYSPLYQAFAWFSDLMIEHSEIYMSLLAVDMDTVLEMQPSDTWDSFPLFQLLNEYLRSHG